MKLKYNKMVQYYEKILNIAKLAGAAAVKYKIFRFIELSTAYIYECSDVQPNGIDGNILPWTAFAKYKLLAEEELRKLESLPLIIVRPANIYGPGDQTFFTPILANAIICKEYTKRYPCFWRSTKKVRYMLLTVVGHYGLYLKQRLLVLCGT